MSSYSIDLPARRRAWLADDGYQVRLTEQARTLAAAAGNIRPTQLCLHAACIPETVENAQLAERDEVRVHFTFARRKCQTEQLSHRRRPRGAA